MILLALLFLFVIVLLAKTVRIVPQARAGIVERFGRYKRTLTAGLNIVVPFIDRVRNLIDLREQVVPFPPQPVITQDNLVVNIDTVIYFQVTDPVAATYEIANYIQAIEQLTMTTLRNIVGGMDLEGTLTCREEINAGLRGVLDEATGKWGIRVNRVELKAIDPPTSIQDSMEKQMRADRDKRAAILTAEGQRQSAILTAEGEKQSAILRAEGERESQILRAQADRGAPAGPGRGPGHPDGLPGHPRRQPRPEAARLPVPADAAEDRRGRRQQALDRAQRDRQGAGGPRLDDERPAGHPAGGRGPRTRVDMGSPEPQPRARPDRRRAEPRPPWRSRRPSPRPQSAAQPTRPAVDPTAGARVDPAAGLPSDPDPEQPTQ